MTFERVARLVGALEDTWADYKDDAKDIEALPLVKDLRLALNVAAADLRPLVVVRGKSEEQAQTLADNLSALVWSDAAIGRFHYVVLSDETDETTHEDLTPELGVSVIQAEVYGRGGEVLAHIGTDAKPAALKRTLAKGLKAHDAPDKEYEDHVSAGRRQGIRWEAETRSTDRHGRGAGREGRRK